MAESKISVDLFNPGQVFACLGLAEAAEALLGGASGAFVWQGHHQPHFLIRASGKKIPDRDRPIS